MDIRQLLEARAKVMIARSKRRAVKFEIAAYTKLGARLGYITGHAIDVAKQAVFEADLEAAINGAVGGDAQDNAIATLDGFTFGYRKALEER
jgi:hypothetical protein